MRRYETGALLRERLAASAQERAERETLLERATEAEARPLPSSALPSPLLSPHSPHCMRLLTEAA